MPEMRFVFPCPGCRARLRVSYQLVTRSCNCPGCGHPVVVPIRTPSEEPSILVMDDNYLPTEQAQSA